MFHCTLLLNFDVSEHISRIIYIIEGNPAKYESRTAYGKWNNISNFSINSLERLPNNDEQNDQNKKR